jgi:8-oxo-dGTP pyrophosphatase MutT (NUDIX family)
VLRPWRRIATSRLQRCRVFDVDEVRFAPPDRDTPETFYRIEAPDWINVIALTADDDVLLVRQYRFGTEEFTLEIPGGMCDPGEAPLVAARRELREETGHEAGEMLELGFVHPNPAIQTNRCYTFLARQLHEAGPPEPDEHEAFELQRVPLERISRLIADGSITHALVVAAFQLLETGERR